MTDPPRTGLLEETSDLLGLRYDDRGLIPVVAQDRESGAVLMLAWANRAALDLTLETGLMHFWSRSRGQLWRKGETSGNELRDPILYADCDGDTVLAFVTPTGPACHTGATTCFGSDPSRPERSILSALAQTVERRRGDRPAGSYTVRLLDDANLRYKKLGEETAELVAALASGRDAQAVEEAADLVYHMVVAVLASGREWSEVEAELAHRAL